MTAPEKFATAEPANPTLRDILSDALRYWEPRRLIYNGALLLVVAGCFAAAWPESKMMLQTDVVLGIFVLAVLVLGTLFASVITYFFVAGMLAFGGIKD